MPNSCSLAAHEPYKTFYSALEATPTVKMASQPIFNPVSYLYVYFIICLLILWISIANGELEAVTFGFVKDIEDSKPPFIPSPAVFTHITLQFHYSFFSCLWHRFLLDFKGIFPRMGCRHVWETLRQTAPLVDRCRNDCTIILCE